MCIVVCIDNVYKIIEDYKPINLKTQTPKTKKPKDHMTSRRWQETAKAALLLDKKDSIDVSQDTVNRAAVEYRRSNGWSKENERYLQQIAEEAIGYKWIYNEASSWYNKCDKGLGVIAVGFSAIAGTSSFGTLVNCSETWWLSIINGIIMFIVTFCAGVQNLMKYSELAEKYDISSKAYSDLHLNIQHELTSKRRYRGLARDIIEKYLGMYLSLNGVSPTPPSWAVARYKERYSDSGISTPMEIKRVGIAEESPATKFRPDTGKGSTTTTTDPSPAQTQTQVAEPNKLNIAGFFSNILQKSSGAPELPVSIRTTQRIPEVPKKLYAQECITGLSIIKDDSTSDDDSSDNEYLEYTPGTPNINANEEYEQGRMLSSSYSGDPLPELGVGGSGTT